MRGKVFRNEYQSQSEDAGRGGAEWRGGWKRRVWVVKIYFQREKTRRERIEAGGDVRIVYIINK